MVLCKPHDNYKQKLIDTQKLDTQNIEKEI